MRRRIGDEYDVKIDPEKIQLLMDGDIHITPHLRRLESMTEDEARKIYEIECSKKWVGENGLDGNPPDELRAELEEILKLAKDVSNGEK